MTKSRKRRLTVGTRVQRYLKSNSLARMARKKVKQAAKVGKRGIKKTRRVNRKITRKRKKLQKRLPIVFRKRRRQLKRMRKALLKRAKRSRKQLRKLVKDYRRGKRPTLRRNVPRHELTGHVDVSRSVIRQASGDPGASRPGEPPKMRTGIGRSAIKAELRAQGKKIVSRTYVDKKIARYMAMWEFRQDGKERPFLKPGLMNNLKTFQTKVGAELNRSATGPKRKATVK